MAANRTNSRVENSQQPSAAAQSGAAFFSWARLAWFVAISYAIVLANMLLAPDPWWFLGRENSDVVNLTLEKGVDDFFQHAGVLLMLTVLFEVAGFTSQWPSRRAIALGCFAYALIGEFLQYFVPLRMLDAYDLFSNATGVAAGLVLMRLLLGPRRGPSTAES